MNIMDILLKIYTWWCFIIGSFWALFILWALGEHLLNRLFGVQFQYDCEHHMEFLGFDDDFRYYREKLKG